MDQYRAVSKVLRDLIQFGLIKEDDRGQARLHLDRLFAAGYDEGSTLMINHNKKEVVECDKNNKEITSYPSVTIAARKVKMDKTTIYKAIWDKRCTRDGHYWKYKEEEV
jgi:hypothetical protein